MYISMNYMLIEAYSKNSKTKECLWVSEVGNFQRLGETMLLLKNSYWLIIGL